MISSINSQVVDLKIMIEGSTKWIESALKVLERRGERVRNSNCISVQKRHTSAVDLPFRSTNSHAEYINICAADQIGLVNWIDPILLVFT